MSERVDFYACFVNLCTLCVNNLVDIVNYKLIQL